MAITWIQVIAWLRHGDRSGFMRKRFPKFVGDDDDDYIDNALTLDNWQH